MKQKTLKPKQVAKPNANTEPEEAEELSPAERMVAKVKPYGSMIALAIALGFLAFIAIIYTVKANLDQSELQWRDLNNSLTEMNLSNGNTTSLKQVANEFPNGRAGLWALQMAGDYDLRVGLSDLGANRDGGLKQIEQAVESLKKVVDAPAAQKSTMLQQRSTFSLAYAYESLGKFEEAKTLYQELVDSAPDSAFAEPAQRGAARAADPSLVALYDKFKNYEETIGDAPGPIIPDRPNIDFPTLDSTFDSGGAFSSEPVTDDEREERKNKDESDESDDQESDAEKSESSGDASDDDEN